MLGNSKKDKKAKKEKKDKTDKKEKKEKMAAQPEASSSTAKSVPPSPPAASGVTPGGPTPATTVAAAREPQAGEVSTVDGLLTVRVIPECPYVCVTRFDNAWQFAFLRALMIDPG